MGIEFSRSYKASDGKCYATLKEAQIVEISRLLRKLDLSQELMFEEIAESIVQNAEPFIDLLTTSENSRPKARAVNGGRKPRKPKATATPQPEAQAAA